MNDDTREQETIERILNTYTVGHEKDLFTPDAVRCAAPHGNATHRIWCEKALTQL